ncbi:hypothetical protein C3B64_13435 [Clostridium botulinum]|uniref:DUF2178 domain-containing protein n=1 Tax=Clostridium botulinum TaxID=1491 RepID=A0AAU8Z313_CLOBO|nr:hypothetical protein [Clostridium sporogenes]AVP65200.1 hypothetical protein C3B64_13435 [Clostridium botulinum]MCF4017489.1 hypothetical protein [Clostridium sporogenes]NFG01088.1 hypothetical protein [Clostridium sporogenes]
MKKSMLYTGIGYLICSITLILFVKLGPNVSFKGVIIGFASALILPGTIMIYKYIRWSKSQNIPIYEARIKEEQINLNDERKIRIRDKSGYITYTIMTWVLLFANLIFSAMKIKTVVLVALWALWLFQYICGVVISKYLEKKL